MADQHGNLPQKKAYDKKDLKSMQIYYEDEYKRISKVQTQVIPYELRILIATAFKSQIGEIRFSLKNIKVLKNRQNVDSK